MKKQELRNLQQEMRTKCISIKKFLANYYGIYSNYDSTNKLSHSDIKILFPYINRISFEQLLQNKRDMYLGKVIPVMDSYGNIAPYANPNKKEIDYKEYFCNNNREVNKIEKVILNEKLSKYELLLLCREYKKTDRTTEYRVAYKLLKEKLTDKSIEYKNKKLELSMKGREHNEY